MPSASAHGGPATKALEQHAVFIPADGNIPPPYAERVRAVVRSARAHGYRIKVAVIASPSDLGADFDLWKRPQRFAADLAEELAALYDGRILIVMPNGFGVGRYGRPAPERSSLAGLRVAAGPAGLANGAVDAVARLARASGYAIAVPRPLHTFTTDDKHEARDRIVIAVAGAAVLIALAAVQLQRRRT